MDSEGGIDLWDLKNVEFECDDRLGAVTMSFTFDGQLWYVQEASVDAAERLALAVMIYFDTLYDWPVAIDAVWRACTDNLDRAAFFVVGPGVYDRYDPEYLSQKYAPIGVLRYFDVFFIRDGCTVVEEGLEVQHPASQIAWTLRSVQDGWD